MKRALTFLLMTVCLAVLLSGCQDSVKTEAELLDDLSSNSFVCNLENIEVTGVSVIKRLTDEDAKTDKVYVSVTIDHPAASATRAYIMNYTHYNEGWMLDSVEAYYGSDAVWKTEPKSPPSGEHILQFLVSASNHALDEQYADLIEHGYSSDLYPKVYFFEEGKYAVTTYTGKFTSDLQYDCIVEIERVFDYVISEETRLMHFQFNPYVYEWELIGEETIDAGGWWYLDGLWKTGYAGETVTFSRTGSYSKATFNGVWKYENEEKNFTFDLSYPRPDYIPLGSAYTISSLSNHAEISFDIMPTQILCYDFEWNRNRVFMLLPDELEKTPAPLEVNGLIDMTVGPEAEEYMNISDELLSSLFINLDTSFLKAIQHPASEFEWFIEQIENYSSENRTTNILHKETQVISAEDTAYTEAFSNLQEKGIDADQLAHCTYYLYTPNDSASWTMVDIVFVKNENTIYVFNIS